MENIFEIIIDNFYNLNELVNSLLINYITHKILILKNIPHKFILGFYNESSQDIENNYSYKHTWIENNNTIYDLSNYINDKLLMTAPIDRINAYYYNNKKNLYTNIPTWKRIDMNNNMDKDYDIIINKLFNKLLVGSDEIYLNDMPKKYKNIIQNISKQLDL
tara:strand:- start:327 stop:812 length:486 start_codon:yes stop_codon:yes gene_type:complete